MGVTTATAKARQGCVVAQLQDEVVWPQHRIGDYCIQDKVFWPQHRIGVYCIVPDRPQNQSASKLFTGLPWETTAVVMQLQVGLSCGCDK